uniref:Uncharacterized protein n=1 Tax=Branchiostoma floridae TaxID=7739 RepID=C3ZU00_BRAFL|eukprot:XP_002587875.1 hypothetical protein BRAFLDRAFT_87262 [Branchiostoma floridae]
MTDAEPSGLSVPEFVENDRGQTQPEEPFLTGSGVDGSAARDQARNPYDSTPMCTTLGFNQLTAQRTHSHIRANRDNKYASGTGRCTLLCDISRRAGSDAQAGGGRCHGLCARDPPRNAPVYTGWTHRGTLPATRAEPTDGCRWAVTPRSFEKIPEDVHGVLSRDVIGRRWALSRGKLTRLPVALRVTVARQHESRCAALMERKSGTGRRVEGLARGTGDLQETYRGPTRTGDLQEAVLSWWRGQSGQLAATLRALGCPQSLTHTRSSVHGHILIEKKSCVPKKKLKVRYLTFRQGVEFYNKSWGVKAAGTVGKQCYSKKPKNSVSPNE